MKIVVTNFLLIFGFLLTLSMAPKMDGENASGRFINRTPLKAGLFRKDGKNVLRVKFGSEKQLIVNWRNNDYDSSALKTQYQNGSVVSFVLPAQGTSLAKRMFVLDTNTLEERKPGKNKGEKWRITQLESRRPYRLTLSARPIPKVSDTWATERATKTIHQMAPSDDVSKWPLIWIHCQQSWKAHHPDFEYVLWTDETLEELVRTIYPSHYDVWKDYPAQIHRADFARALILYYFGGIYADMDYYCNKRFFEALPVGVVAVAESAWAPKELMQNALMISPQRHPYWHYVIGELMARSVIGAIEDGDRTLEMTGPKIFEDLAKIVPKNMFFSLPRAKYSPLYYVVNVTKSHMTITFNSSATNTTLDMVNAIHIGTCTWCGI